MDVLRAWILGVAVTAMVLSAARALMPEGPVKRVGRLTAGLALTLALLAPLRSLAGLDPGDWTAGLVTEGDTAAAQRDAVTPIIEGELAAYIEEKGRALGADCTASVTCVPDENGVPIPRGAVVTGRLTAGQRAGLSACIASDLGLPPETQTFREG